MSNKEKGSLEFVSHYDCEVDVKGEPGTHALAMSKHKVACSDRQQRKDLPVLG